MADDEDANGENNHGDLEYQLEVVEIESDEDSDNSDDNFHDAENYAEPHVEESSSSEEEIPTNKSNNNMFSKKKYDKSLTGTHSYLGTDLEEVRGRTVHEDDSWLSLPIMFLPGVVLMPGQTLPLHLFQPSSVALMRNIVRQDKTFGILTASYLNTDNVDDKNMKVIGTTVEIFSFKEEEDEVGIITARAKGMGRQRFIVKDTRRQIDGVMVANVRILPEKKLPDILHGVKLPNRSTRELERTIHMTHHPPWVYKTYDVALLMNKVKDELGSWNDSLDSSIMPGGAAEFSFWVAANLPLDDKMKLKLLAMDNAVMRLHCELALMARCTLLCCDHCGREIANKTDVFSMALEGPLGAYVNPGGFVHETLTLHKAHNLKLRGRPSTENSWFPGYAWTILECDGCSRHMGWKFTAAKMKLKPKKFWGLCRSSIKPQLQQPEDDDYSIPFL